jgi:alanyl-tRNA synthetase
LLWKVSEVLAAPLDKLDKTAEKVVKELKEANVEKRRLIKELAAKESAVGQAKTCEDTVEADGVTIVKRDFGEVIDADRMLRTASEIIKRNEATVTLFYGSDAKTCKLMVMAGEVAVQKGVNAGNIVKEAVPVFGGGGGGRPNFAQGGGTKPDKLKEAVQAAEEAVKKQLKH